MTEPGSANGNVGSVPIVLKDATGLSIAPNNDISLPLLDAAELDELSTAGSAAIDGFLIARVKFLKRSYEKIGNPKLIYMAAEPLSLQISQLPKSKSSFQYSQLLAFMAEMLLAEGRDRVTLEHAERCIERAFDVLTRVDILSDEVMKAYISNALHHGIIVKALGRHDEALGSMNLIRDFALKKLGASNLDVLMLSRQKVLMHQEFSLFARMAEHAGSYAREKPLEYFGTVKRVFEFSLNTNRYDDAVTILPEFKRSYRAARQKLPAISHISFSKNLAQYYLHSGDAKRGLAILEFARNQAVAMNLKGQERQIISLISAASSSSIELKTFLVE